MLFSAQIFLKFHFILHIEKSIKLISQYINILVTINKATGNLGNLDLHACESYLLDKFLLEISVLHFYLPLGYIALYSEQDFTQQNFLNLARLNALQVVNHKAPTMVPKESRVRVLPFQSIYNATLQEIFSCFQVFFRYVHITC